jgi:hypothetical protein
VDVTPIERLMTEIPVAGRQPVEPSVGQMGRRREADEREARHGDKPHRDHQVDHGPRQGPA